MNLFSNQTHDPVDTKPIGNTWRTTQSENVIYTVAHLLIDKYAFELTGCWPFVCKTEFLIRECKCARILCLETTVFKVDS